MAEGDPAGKRMKGITPIISTIVLLLITVALAGAAWTYMSGFMGSYTEKSFIIPTGGAYCDASRIFHVRVVNTGTTTITAGDWVSALVEGLAPPNTFTTSSVAPKGTAEFTIGTGAAGTSYTIVIGTIGGIQRIPVVCP